MTPGPFWTRQKRLEAFQTLNKNLATWKLFFLEGAPQFTEPLKQLWAHINAYSPVKHPEYFFYFILFSIFSKWTSCQGCVINYVDKDFAHSKIATYIFHLIFEVSTSETKNKKSYLERVLTHKTTLAGWNYYSWNFFKHLSILVKITLSYKE